MQPSKPSPTKRYKNFTISQDGDWWDVYRDGKFFAKVVGEEEARRVVWENTGRGEFLTDKMMEVVL